MIQLYEHIYRFSRNKIIKYFTTIEKVLTNNKKTYQEKV